MRPLVVIGAGWHGREVMKICGDAKLWGGKKAFLDDNVTGEVDGVPVHGKLDVLEDPTFLQDHSLALGIGDNKLRTEIGQHIIRSRGNLLSVIHPTAIVWSEDIGLGSVIFPFAIISVAAKVGKFCIVNKHATVGHGADMADGCNVADACAFSGKMGAGSMMGMHAVTIPGVDIGENTMVGAGAICIKSVDDNAKVAGVPAKPIK